MPVTPDPMSTPRLIRIKDVEHLTSLSRSTIYARIRAGAFPPSIQVSPGMTRWYEAEVIQWIQDQLAKRRDYTDA